MRIIYPGLVQGWGVLVFHIVESLVFSAHIVRLSPCHEACAFSETNMENLLLVQHRKERKREPERVRPHIL